MNSMFNKRYKIGDRGFTLIELLIVIAIIAILASVAFVALNPAKRFADARDSTRWSAVSNIQSAISVDQVDNGGTFLASIGAMAVDTPYMIGTDDPDGDCGALVCDVDVDGADNCVDLSGLVTEGYIGNIPVSPSGANIAWGDDRTGYYATYNDVDGDGGGDTLTVGACESEETDDIFLVQ